MAPGRNVHTGLRQGQEQGPIDFFNKTPRHIPCTGPGPVPIPLQCE